jgi:uncharacterized protein YukE
VTEFAPPPGDPEALAAAARTLAHVAGDVDQQHANTRTGVITAAEHWRGTRARDFELAGAGLQVELVGAAAGLSSVGQVLAGYAEALREARDTIAALGRQAHEVAAGADRQVATLSPDDPQIDQIYQHAGRQHGLLLGRAAQSRSTLDQLAARAAAAVDAETEAIVPGGALLSPDQLRRQVDSALGLTGLSPGAADGRMTQDQAWAAVEVAKTAVPADAVTAEGDVDWTKALAEFNDKYLGPPVSAAAVGAAPFAGWALRGLVQAQSAAASYVQAAQVSDAMVAEQLAALLRTGQITEQQAALGQLVTRSTLSTGYFFGPAGDVAEATTAARTGMIPEAGLLGYVGKGLGALAIVSDAITIVDPGVENKTEGNVLRVTAGANLVATAAVLGGEGTTAVLATALGVEAASIGWVPVAGQVVLVVTGLVLAGDYLYHHWDEVKHLAADAGDAVVNAAEDTGHALASGAKAVGHFFSSLF